MASAATSSAVREIFGRLPDGTAVERIQLRAARRRSKRGSSPTAPRCRRCSRRIAGATSMMWCSAMMMPRPMRPRGVSLGATIGRFANRIAGARFDLDGAPVILSRRTTGPNALHGGVEGFRPSAVDHRGAGGWSGAGSDAHLSQSARRRGYPGTLDVSVTYRITAPGELSVETMATTDRPTVVSLTNHSFFNLDGVAGDSNILGHRLTVAADAFLATDETAIPLPEVPAAWPARRSISALAHDIGARICRDDEQLRCGRGYDH